MAFRRLGIIGGSGLESLLQELSTTEARKVETPFGPPSGPIALGELDGVPIAALSRHGPGHRLSPSAVPYRANLFALRMLGATHVIATGAVGSLREEIHPGELVGADLVGMTAMPEAKLAREAQLCYALVSLPTDYDCWREADLAKSAGSLLAEIQGNMKLASARALQLLRSAAARIAERGRAPCGCQSSLELGIWTEPKSIPTALMKRLAPLLERPT